MKSLGNFICQDKRPWRLKSRQVVREIGNRLYVDDLISGATAMESAKLLNVEASEIFEALWHWNNATLEFN